jgi:hypothetical protein
MFVAAILAGAVAGLRAAQPGISGTAALLSAPAADSRDSAASAVRPSVAGGVGREGVHGTRRESVRALREYLKLKEAELAQLVVERKKVQREAESLAPQVKAQKERTDLSWFERKSLERSMGRLRAQLESIEKTTARERDVRDQAFACAAAIVAELEDSLNAALGRLYEQQKSGGSTADQVEWVMDLEKERKLIQRKADGLRPEIPIPAELPTGVPWSKEMLEDQRSAYEANIARLLDEREQLVREKELRKSLGSVLPGSKGADAESMTRLDARIAEYDRKIAMYREKKDRLSPGGSGSRRKS